MSTKKEVNSIANVYSKLLSEEVDSQGNILNIGYDASSGGPGIPNTDMTDPGLGNGMAPAATADENGESLGCMGAPQQEDGNLSMAKSEVFKIYKYACELQKLFLSSDLAIEPWQLSKLTKAADYMCSVTGSLEYDEFEKMAKEAESELMGMGSPVVVKIKDMLASEPMGVNEEVLKQVIFNIECIKEAKKEKHCNCKSAKKGCKCSGCKDCKANQKK